jgi:hypothetical protein
MSKKPTTNKVNIEKILAALGSVLILLALSILAFTPEASGYEPSIYNAYPNYFWVIIILSLMCGILILIHKAFTDDKQHSQWYLAGIFILIATNLIVITLPISRGYFISDFADEVSHLGMIKDILLNGHVGVNNFYPISHILTSQINLLTGLDVRFVIKIMPAIFYLIYLAGLFLLARQTSKNIRVTILVMGFGTPLLFTFYTNLFLPTQFCLYVMPMLLYLFFRCNENHILNRIILFYLFLSMVPFLHPLGAILIVAIFILLGIAEMTRYLGLKKNGGEQIDRSFAWGVIWPPAVILFILFFGWFSNFSFFKFVLSQFFSGGASPLDDMVQQGATARITLLDFVRLLFNNNGQDLLMLFLALIAAGIVARKFFLKSNAAKNEELFFSYLFLAFSLLYLASILVNFTGTGTDIRILCWSLVACVLLNGIVFYEWIGKLKRGMKNLAVVGLAVVIIAMSSIAIFNVYFSPFIKRTSLQGTMASMSGMQWFIENKGTENTFYFGPLVPRAASYLYGWDSPKPDNLGSFNNIPSHFGYNADKPKPGELTQVVYLVVNRSDLEGKKLFPDVGIYTMDELDQLRANPGVNRIYFNGDADIMEVLPTTWQAR